MLGDIMLDAPHPGNAHADPDVDPVQNRQMMSDPFNLQRFVDAQEPLFEHVTAELRAGLKRTHWMWFIFPQIRGLGFSRMAQHYAIASLQEAAAYLHHPVLGPRLRDCTRTVNEVQGRSIEQIFGDPDFRKFRSSMTLFARATSDNRTFLEALDKYHGGEPDGATLERLQALG
jgi:uncharacterized protein (DUF1810 family)